MTGRLAWCDPLKHIRFNIYKYNHSYATYNISPLSIVNDNDWNTNYTQRYLVGLGSTSWIAGSSLAV